MGNSLVNTAKFFVLIHKSINFLHLLITIITLQHLRVKS